MVPLVCECERVRVDGVDYINSHRFHCLVLLFAHAENSRPTGQTVCAFISSMLGRVDAKTCENNLVPFVIGSYAMRTFHLTPKGQSAHTHMVCVSLPPPTNDTCARRHLPAFMKLVAETVDARAQDREREREDA